MNDLVIAVSLDSYHALERLQSALNARELEEAQRDNRAHTVYSLEAAAHYALQFGISWLELKYEGKS